MDLWFWLVLTVLVVGVICFYLGHWAGYGKGEADTREWYRELKSREEQ